VTLFIQMRPKLVLGSPVTEARLPLFRHPFLADRMLVLATFRSLARRDIAPLKRLLCPSAHAVGTPSRLPVHPLA
jgi:hypothetical protein